MIRLDRRDCLLGASGAALVLVTSADAGMKEKRPMSANNKQVILDFIQVVWRQGELEALPRFWTTDCVNHAASAGHQQGLVALRAYHEGFSAAFVGFTNVDIAVLQQIAEDDRVTTQLRTSAHHTASDKTVTLDTIRIDRLSNGKIAEHWSVADMAGFLHQLSS